MVKTSTILVTALLTLLAPRVAHAKEEAAAPEAASTPPVPALHHAPRVMTHEGEDVSVSASIDHPEQLRRALLVWRADGGSGEVELERSSSSVRPYVATIPGATIKTKLAYAIELEAIDGTRISAFATRADPYPVTVLDTAADAREAALLARLGGRRSVVSGSGEYVDFGTVTADVPVATPGAPPTTQRRTVSDRYYRVEGSYTYRLLGTISEFGIRAGVVRGRSLVPGEIDSAKYDVGLNYGAPRARLRLDDWLHVESELLTSVTEVGFSVGGGAAILLGDPYGSKLVFGGETIQVFGTRGFSRLDVVASRLLMFSPTIEVTTMPHADRAGVRLITDVGLDLGSGFRLDLRAGYQARSFERGGPSLGGELAYAF